MQIKKKLINMNLRGINKNPLERDFVCLQTSTSLMGVAYGTLMVTALCIGIVCYGTSFCINFLANSLVTSNNFNPEYWTEENVSQLSDILIFLELKNMFHFDHVIKWINFEGYTNIRSIDWNNVSNFLMNIPHEFLNIEQKFHLFNLISSVKKIIESLELQGHLFTERKLLLELHVNLVNFLGSIYIESPYIENILNNNINWWLSIQDNITEEEKRFILNTYHSHLINYKSFNLS
jgi:hypothetical protein